MCASLKENPQNWGALGRRPLGEGRRWPPRNTPPPTCVILLNLVVLGQTVQALLRRSAWKFEPRVPSFKVTPGYRNRHVSIRHLWLPITFHNNHGPIPYRFRDKRWFQSNVANFPTPVYFAPHRRVPLELDIYTRGVRKKDRMMGLPGRERSLTISSAVWMQYANARDRQTDGRTYGHTDTGRQQRPRLRIASRGHYCWGWSIDVMIWLELCATYSSSSPVVTTTSIILCFNKHRLTLQVHLENGR